MKHTRFMFACLTMLFMVFGMFSVALAGYNLSLQATSDGSTVKAEFQRGDNLYLNILLDDPTEVAGCAFTLNYPAGVLVAPATSGEGTPVTPGEIVSSFPFTYESTDTHRENSSEPGKIYFSGAAINTTTGGGIYNSAGEIVLFTVKFTVKDDAPFGNFQLSLTQTELWNLDAGYGTDNNGNGQYDPGVDEKDTVPVLVGAVDNQDPNWDNLGEAFPVLLGDSANPYTPATVDLSVPPSQLFYLDVDGNGAADALTDGLLIIRYLFGFTGNTLIDGAVATDCARCTAAEIEAYLAENITDLDVDGNGAADALTDGLLIIRYLFGFTGNTLIDGAVATDCERCTATDIEAYLQQYMP